MSESQSGDEMLEEAASQISNVLADTGQDDLIVDEVADDPVQDDVVLDDDSAEADGTADEINEDQQEIDRARAQGWRPLDEYNGDKSKWKDYKEFNAVGDKITSRLNSKIDYQNSKLEKQEAMIKQLIKSQGQVAKQAQAEALAKLKSQRREAIELGDADAVDDIDEQIETVKSQEQIELDESEALSQPQADPEVLEFVEVEKSWFNAENPDMVMYAQEMESAARKMNPNADSGRIMGMVKRAVVSRFPDRFNTQPSTPTPKRGKQIKHSTVESGTVAAPAGGIRRFSELPPEARRIAEQFDRDGIMSKKDYMKQYNEGLA